LAQFTGIAAAKSTVVHRGREIRWNSAAFFKMARR